VANSGSQNWCEAVNKDGKPCGGYRLVGSEYCSAHDPENKAAMAEARRLGGITTGQRIALRVLEESAFEGATVGSVGDLLVETINQVRTGKIDIRVANAVGYLSNILIRARETADLELRLEKLETTLEEMRKDHRAAA